MKRENTHNPVSPFVRSLIVYLHPEQLQNIFAYKLTLPWFLKIKPGLYLNGHDPLNYIFIAFQLQ